MIAIIIRNKRMSPIRLFPNFVIFDFICLTFDLDSLENTHKNYFRFFSLSLEAFAYNTLTYGVDLRV